MTDEDGAATGDTWSIEPGTVTINTLTINGKQVTVDVFRQLKEAVLINHDGSLAGSPWGLVNYHQKRCDKLEKHAHVVWQLGDQLRQDTIQAPRWEPFRSATCGALVFARGTMKRLPGSTMWSGVPPEDPVRPRQSRPSWFSRKSHQDLVRAPPDEPEEPARFRGTLQNLAAGPTVRVSGSSGSTTSTASNAAPSCATRSWAARSWRPSTPPRCERIALKWRDQSQAWDRIPALPAHRRCTPRSVSRFGVGGCGGRRHACNLLFPAPSTLTGGHHDNREQ